MNTCFMDTNLFIRYLVNDDPGKADRVEKLLEQATSGKIRLVTADLVIAEGIWVLESAYGLKNAEITPMVKGILATPGIEGTNAELVGRSLDYYESLNIDEFVKNLRLPIFVIPAKAGIQLFQDVLDPGFRRGDAPRDFLRDHQY